MQVFQTEAIILRRTNYGEADRILNLLTPQRGKVSAIAKSVRKSKSKLAGGLELFATCHISVTEGRGTIGIVTSARLERFYGNILHDYERMQLGYECIKTINRIAETVTEADFYYLLRDSFSYLDNLHINSTLIELWFRLQFIGLLGYGVNLATDVEGAKLAIDKQYSFDLKETSFVVQPKGVYTADHIKLLRLASVKSPVIMQQVSGIDIIAGECLKLVRLIET